MRLHGLRLLLLLPVLVACEREPDYDLLVRGGTIYDGSGSPGLAGDVAIRGDRIAYVGPEAPGRARREIDATGKAVAPGFINMLSWSSESLLVDGRGQGELRQGVTLQVMGEGFSMGPLNAALKEEMLAQQGQVQRALAQPRLPGHDLPLDRRERFLRMRHIGLRGDGDPQVARGHDRGSQGAVAQVDTLTDDEQFGDAPRVILAQGLLVDRLVEQETADQLEEQYRQAMDESRAEAARLAAEAKSEAAKATEARVVEADAAAQVRLEEAGRRIQEARTSAMAEIEAVAAEAAVAMVERVAGVAVDPAVAQAAVKQELGRGH